MDTVTAVDNSVADADAAAEVGAGAAGTGAGNGEAAANGVASVGTAASVEVAGGVVLGDRCGADTECCSSASSISYDTRHCLQLSSGIKPNLMRAKNVVQPKHRS